MASAQLIQLHRFGRTFWQNSPLFLAHLKAIERTHLIDLPSGQFTEEKRESKKPETNRIKRYGAKSVLIPEYLNYDLCVLILFNRHIRNSSANIKVKEHFS